MSRKKPSKTEEDLAKAYQRGLKNLAELWSEKLRFTPEELMKQNEARQEQK
jgi:hypothetical protein